MHEHLNLTRLHAEEPFSLDHLEALVHHRGRVDGNLSAHVPSRMAQGVGLRHPCQLVGGHQAEGTSAGREQDLVDRVTVLADETLEDGRVLAVDGQDGHVILLCQLQDELAGHDQRLLVGKGDGLAGTDGMNRRRKACKAHHRRENHVDGLGLHNLVEGPCAGIYLHVGQVLHQVSEPLVVGLVGDDHGGRLPLVGLCSQLLHAVVGRQTVHLIAVAMLADHLQGLCADAPCGAQYGYLFALHSLCFVLFGRKSTKNIPNSGIGNYKRI